MGCPLGKSTLFNALTAAGADAANYPFCTVEPNVGMVEVPDARVDLLAEKVQPQRVLRATVQFVDIAGLVKGASEGEGLGNQFLANIRETDAIVHVVRCFDDDDVVHVMGSVDPVRDREVINLELALADLAWWRSGWRRPARRPAATTRGQAELGCGRLVEVLGGASPRAVDANEDEQASCARTTCSRPSRCSTWPTWPKATCRRATTRTSAPCARPWSRAASAPRSSPSAARSRASWRSGREEKREFLESRGSASRLHTLIRTGTAAGAAGVLHGGRKEVRAWEIPSAQRRRRRPASSQRLERGFIRAETVAFADFESWAASRPPASRD